MLLPRMRPGNHRSPVWEASLWGAASSGRPGREAPLSGPGITEAVRGSWTHSALTAQGLEGFYIILALFTSLSFSKNKQTGELLPLTA